MNEQTKEAPVLSDDEPNDNNWPNKAGKNDDDAINGNDEELRNRVDCLATSSSSPMAVFFAKSNATKAANDRQHSHDDADDVAWPALPFRRVRGRHLDWSIVDLQGTFDEFIRWRHGTILIGLVPLRPLRPE